MGMTGEQIKAARLAKGLSQAELAQQLDMTIQTIYRWEHGRVVPPRHSEIALREVLGLKKLEPRGKK